MQYSGIRKANSVPICQQKGLSIIVSNETQERGQFPQAVKKPIFGSRKGSVWQASPAVRFAVQTAENKSLYTDMKELTRKEFSFRVERI